MSRLQGFPQSAGSYRNDIAFAPLAQSLENLQHIAGLHLVLVRHLVVVDAKFVGELRHACHQAVCPFRGAIPLVCSGRRNIGVIGGDIKLHVVHFQKRQCLGTGVHRHGEAVVAVRTGVCPDVHPHGRDGAVFLCTHLDGHPHRVPCTAVGEFLFPGVPIENRFAGDVGAISNQILDQDILLRAIAATDMFLDDPDFVLRKPGHPRDDSPDMPRHLSGVMNLQPPVVDQRITGMRFQRRALDLTGLIGPLDDHVRLAKPFLYIADRPMSLTGDIVADVPVKRELINDFPVPLLILLVVLVQIGRCAAAILHQSVVDQRSAWGHGLFYGEHRFEHLVVDLDQLRGALCVLHRIGDDGGHAVPHEPDMPVQQSPVMRTRFRISLSGLHVKHVRTVRSGDDLHHSRSFLRFADVDTVDERRGIRTAQHVQTVRFVSADSVLDETPLSRDELRSIDLAYRLADVMKVLTERRGGRFGIPSMIPHFRGEPYGKIVPFITGIPDENSAENLLHFVFRRMGSVFQQPREKQCGFGRVVGTLDDACVDHRLLDDRQVPGVTQPVRSPNLLSISLNGHHQVRIDGHVIDDDGIASREALPVVAIAHTEMPQIHQHFPEALPRLHHDRLPCPVDCTGDAAHTSSL